MKKSPSGFTSRGLRQPLIKLGLSGRTYNALEGAGIETIGSLLQKSILELFEIRNFGASMLREIAEKISYTDLR